MWGVATHLPSLIEMDLAVLNNTVTKPLSGPQTVASGYTSRCWPSARSLVCSDMRSIFSMGRLMNSRMRLAIWSCVVEKALNCFSRSPLTLVRSDAFGDRFGQVTQAFHANRLILQKRYDGKALRM